MDSSLKRQLLTHLNEYETQIAYKAPSSGDDVERIGYGTAGFRGKATQLEHIFFKVGLISGLRCLKLKANIGVMITASHNPVEDNGVKLIDSNGEMLEPAWEQIVERFCNSSNGNQELVSQLETLIIEHDIMLREGEDGKVFIGMDTRPSSEILANLLKQGLRVWLPHVEFIDYGLITTPALHYVVGESNRLEGLPVVPIKAYYDALASGLVGLFDSEPKRSPSLYDPASLIIDCANGVGVVTMQNLCIIEDFVSRLPLKLINTGEGTLNKLCGADFVKTTHKPPQGIVAGSSSRYASLDGDADRLVYFLSESNASDADKVLLFDGDKIMALFAMYLKDALEETGLNQEISLGVVQTAYANGASTDYMTQVLGLKVDCVETGVKNLHKQAKYYDIGVFFEANGHGTLCVSPKARSKIESCNNDAVSRLKKLLALINSYTGDAISDILVVEMILKHYDWDMKRWDQLYQDKPNSLIKVEIKDRNMIKTANADRICIEPKALQQEIDLLVHKFNPGTRCFVRPSGTENVVRVYAEALELDVANKLATLVGEKVVEICNGNDP